MRRARATRPTWGTVSAPAPNAPRQGRTGHSLTGANLLVTDDSTHWQSDRGLSCRLLQGRCLPCLPLLLCLHPELPYKWSCVRAMQAVQGPRMQTTNCAAQTSCTFAAGRIWWYSFGYCNTAGLMAPRAAPGLAQARGLWCSWSRPPVAANVVHVHTTQQEPELVALCDCHCRWHIGHAWQSGGQAFSPNCHTKWRRYWRGVSFLWTSANDLEC